MCLATFSLKQELLPSTQVPTAMVTATFPGTSPQIVADEVATPIEHSVKAVSGVTKVESSSTNGLATISVQWDYGLDSDKVVSDIRSAVDSRRADAAVQVETEVIRGSTDDIPVLLLAVASDASLNETGRLVENVAVPDLAGIDGVRQVSVAGENTLQLVVTLRPTDLRKHDLTAQAVTETVRAQAIVTPAGTSHDGRPGAVGPGRQLAGHASTSSRRWRFPPPTTARSGCRRSPPSRSRPSSRPPSPARTDGRR